MKQHRATKILYTNVFKQPQLKKSVLHVEYRNHSTSDLFVAVLQRFKFVTQGATLCLLISLCLQPVYANENTASAATTTVDTDTTTVVEKPVLVTESVSSVPNVVAEDTATQKPRTRDDQEESESKDDPEPATSPDEIVRDQVAGDDSTSTSAVIRQEQGETVRAVNDVAIASSTIHESIENETDRSSTTAVIALENGAEQSTSTTRSSTSSSGVHASTSLSTTSTTTDPIENTDIYSTSENNTPARTTLTPSEESTPDVNESESEPHSEETASPDEVASSTAVLQPSNVESQAVLVTQSNSEFSFNKEQCTLVDDGSYYCQKGVPTETKADDLFAAPDSDGDLEIFVRRGGENMQITSNLVDDASPYFDTVSNSVVWHRLTSDRYQIISYDVETGKETQITSTAVNNMEPTRSGDVTVWQRWVEDNWEIVLFQDQTEIQLTDTPEHDIAPHIRGTLVIWNVRATDGTHSLMTYDITSGVYNEISDSDGVAVSNPRMVVVYDALYENGDTVLKGFDILTGQVIPLQHIPGELPPELPSPDSTGETRALVVSPPNKPEHADTETGIDPESDQPDPPTEPGTLDLRNASTTSDVVPASNDANDLDLRDRSTSLSVPDEVYDIVIPNSSSSSST